MPLMNGIRAILLFVPSLLTCLSTLSSHLFGSAHCTLLGVNFLFLSMGLSTLSSLYSRGYSHCVHCTPLCASRGLQSQHVMTAFLWTIVLSPATIHMTVGSQSSIFDFFITCITLRSCAPVGARQEMQSQCDMAALLGFSSVSSLSPGTIHMAVGSQSSIFDFFITCITLRSCASIGARQEMHSQCDMAALLGFSSLSSLSLAVIFIAAGVQLSTFDFSKNLHYIEVLHLHGCR